MADSRTGDSRMADRASVHYTINVTPHAARPSPDPFSSHGTSHSRSSSYTRGSKPTTPLASPYPVGQFYPSQPPKLSPTRTPPAREPSPNYFGLIPETSADTGDSALASRDNWSPPSSSIKSFAAAIPKPVQISGNPDYEAFKRQADANRGESFALSTSHFGLASASAEGSVPRPRPQRWHTYSSETFADIPSQRVLKEPLTDRMDVDRDHERGSAYVSSESKRNSDDSLQAAATVLNLPRFDLLTPFEASPEKTTMPPSNTTDRQPCLSMPQNKASVPSSNLRTPSNRKADAPSDRVGGPSLILASQLKQMIESFESDSELLILDLRMSQQYYQARVKGALNLCTPTTLLKRATFNLQRLQQTFQNPADKEQFSQWASSKNLVIYDAHSADVRDAVACLNMAKKFTNEGYKGGIFILRGGFNAFYEKFPELVEECPAAGSGSPQSSAPGQDNARLGIPPIIGGVMLPSASSSPNPFFSNIRQNMDLADGVGQFEIARPRGVDSPTLPQWLREASTEADRGKKVSDKFLHIERDEQERMKKAYSAFSPQSNPEDPCPTVQLSGIEQGAKNRYKDILPFDHSRVKLQGRPSGACDYVNASHLKASGSNKRYIASQGPLPATFEDFWSVIWDQDVRVIVMLTAESEGGQLKCHPYWKSNDFGPIQLRPLLEKKVSLDIDKHRSTSHPSSRGSSSTVGSEAGRRRANTTTTFGGATPAPQPMPSQSESPYVIIRKFALSHSAHPFAPIREVTHLQYPSWPDFGTPAQPSHLLALVEVANVMQRAALPVNTPSVAASGSYAGSLAASFQEEPENDPRARPMLVHCSAGCGRTGTFCAVDSVIDMLKRQRLARTTLRPVKKRDSDGDIKMSGQREVEEPTSPRLSQARTGASAVPSPHRMSGLESRRSSWEEPPLDTSWVGDDTVDLIAKTVEDFRGQRISMVQTLRQFVLCYETVLEYVARANERSGAPSANNGKGRGRSGSLQVGRDQSL
ncbi:hypothetical protein SODALDRAFT_347380 [Sodiomyces alkalinus F11]|uniref:protein-tyrosine-phosphatase n=1 Tax=Sodiomyces alkalinus (strain CBS 110278 / VKM F-3762 / F11) TaxID=1314773 RepID=A0A3N2Q6I2_SODAK|nr:hypothetical protein SODALDRAFT_347380 [Sodiomyces alkalinus F11]ROT42374.1 hypothetical protein SODALDRAFT_347380 [Sodiomyces alkalinus F11]